MEKEALEELPNVATKREMITNIVEKALTIVWWFIDVFRLIKRK